MYENAVALDPDFALAHAGLAKVCAEYFYHFERQQKWIDRAIIATQRASATGHEAPEIECAKAWVLFAGGSYAEAAGKMRKALDQTPDLDGGYYLLGRSLFADGRYQEVVDMMEEAMSHAGENYNTTVPIHNALGALGKRDALINFSHREIAIYEAQVKKVPEDARARVLLAGNLAMHGRVDEAKREVDMAMILRPDDTMILYNSACAFCELNLLDEALNAIKKAWEAGFRDAIWTRQDPDLQLLHGHPEFERLYPPPKA
jgi:tetratricopeptide (TPR) repeat protein